MATDIVMIYTTVPDRNVASGIAEDLIERKLAGCVNIIENGLSIYRWEGELKRSAEVYMLIKTTRYMVDKVRSEFKRLHPYDMPAFLVFPVENGDAEFLQWLRGQTERRAEGD